MDWKNIIKKLRGYSTFGIISKIEKNILFNIGLKTSKTYFLKCEVHKDLDIRPEIFRIEILDKNNKKEFEKINFYSFLDVNDIIFSSNNEIFIAKVDKRII